MIRSLVSSWFTTSASKSLRVYFTLLALSPYETRNRYGSRAYFNFNVNGLRSLSRRERSKKEKENILTLERFAICFNCPLWRDRVAWKTTKYRYWDVISIRLQKLDTRIIIGSFSPQLASRVLCEVNIQRKCADKLFPLGEGGRETRIRIFFAIV